MSFLTFFERVAVVPGGIVLLIRIKGTLIHAKLLSIAERSALLSFPIGVGTDRITRSAFLFISSFEAEIAG